MKRVGFAVFILGLVILGAFFMSQDQSPDYSEITKVTLERMAAEGDPLEVPRETEHFFVNETGGGNYEKLASLLREAGWAIGALGSETSSEIEFVIGSLIAPATEESLTDQMATARRIAKVSGYFYDGWQVSRVQAEDSGQ